MQPESQKQKNKNKANTEEFLEKMFQKMEEEYPLIIFRSSVAQLTEGGINPRTLANLDSQGLGPDGMFYVGRKAAYFRANYIRWIRSRVHRI